VINIVHVIDVGCDCEIPVRFIVYLI